MVGKWAILFSQLGLTTQVSNTIKIGKKEVRPSFRRGRYTISFIKQKNTITRNNIPLLQILDAIRYIKKIPDAAIVSSCKRLLAILNSLSLKDKAALVKLALKYPPSARALLGTLLEDTGNGQLTGALKKSLNPITIYKLPGVNKISVAGKWNIK
jgi:hypothetical protein